MSKVIVWLTNDLRVEENPIIDRLNKAGRDYIPVFVYPRIEDQELKQYIPISNLREDFLRKNIEQLSADFQTLDKQLIILDENVPEKLFQLCEEHSISKILASENQMIGLMSVVNDAESFLAKKGIFTDFFHTDYWMDLEDMPFPILRSPEIFKDFLVRTKGVKLNEQGKLPQHTAAVLKQLFTKIQKSQVPELLPYETKLNNNFSKLLPYLSLGVISPGMLYQFVKKHKKDSFFSKNAAELLRRQLIKLDFIKMQYFKHPTKAFKRQILSLAAQDKMKSWINGDTGNKMVDAIMKKLKSEGNISLTSKRIVIQYYLNFLRLPPYFGHWYFANQLVEFEPALNFYLWNKQSYQKQDGWEALDEIKSEQKNLDPAEKFVGHWTKTLLV